MKYYKTTTEYNCGIDLHARSMYVCVTDSKGNKLLHMNIRDNDFEFFLRKIKPWRHDITVCCECLFCWYWLADACLDSGLNFVLAHALYLKAIHGGKNKNDRIDSEKLAHLLRSNLIPPSYVYPAKKRPIRALLRQRIKYVEKRSDVIRRIECFQLAEGKEPVPRGSRNRDPWQERLIQGWPDPHHQLLLQSDLATVRHYDAMIAKLEGQLVKTTRNIASRDYTLLKTITGVGQAIALTLLYEIDDINRYPGEGNFCSHCRLVNGTVASAGKIKGLKGAKLGNPYLRWAFGEAAVLGVRHCPLIAAYRDKIKEIKNCKNTANAILAAKLGRAVFHMLKNHTTFDVERLVGSGSGT